MSLIIQPNEQILTRIRDAIVPAQQIPSLGRFVSLVCPQGKGLANYLPTVWGRDSGWYIVNSQRFTKPSEIIPDYMIVLYGATLDLMTQTPPMECGQALATHSVSGHILHSPVPSSGDPRWKPLRFCREFQSFIDSDGDPIFKADLVMITPKDMINWQSGCNASFIEDVAKL